MLLRPVHKQPTSELRAIIGSYGLRLGPKGSSPVPQPGDVLCTNAEVCCDVHILMAEVVSCRQALDAPRDGSRPIDGIAKKSTLQSGSQFELPPIAHACQCAWSSCVS